MAKKIKPEELNYAFDIFSAKATILTTPSTPKKSGTKVAHPGVCTTKDALELAQDNYKNYSIYVAQGRAYPNIKDGAKSVYKRAIYGMWKDAPRTKVKVAELAAYALPYHPHPTSISGVIVSLGENGNKLKFLETQGNFGDSSKGVQASADRYIEGKLSNTAIELLCDGIEYCPTVTGELDYLEPEALPSLFVLSTVSQAFPQVFLNLIFRV